MPATVSEPAVGRGSMLRRGVLAVVGATVANAAVLAAVRASGLVAPFPALQYLPVALFTAAGAVGATVVYGFLAARSDAPDRRFVELAAVVLVLSVLPDIALLSVDPMATVGGVVVLMALHVVAAVVIVATLLGRWP